MALEECLPQLGSPGTPASGRVGANWVPSSLWSSDEVGGTPGASEAMLKVCDLKEMLLKNKKESAVSLPHLKLSDRRRRKYTY